MIVVVDTTVWIDFFAANGTIFDRHFTELIEGDAPIALVDIVYCEPLWRGLVAPYSTVRSMS